MLTVRDMEASYPELREESGLLPHSLCFLEPPLKHNQTEHDSFFGGQVQTPLLLHAKHSDLNVQSVPQSSFSPGYSQRHP